MLVAVASMVVLGCSPPLAESPSRATFAAQTSTSIAQGCGDLLARLGRKPAAARFIGCKSFPEEQAAPLRATYDVAGSDAAAVEETLVRATGLKPLQRSCCQWDTDTIGFNDANGRQFTITMTSGETRVTRRTDWARIPKFVITVEMLTEPI